MKRPLPSSPHWVPTITVPGTWEQGSPPSRVLGRTFCVGTLGGTCPPSSRSWASPSASRRRCSRSTTCRSPSTAARCAGCSARTARARPPPCACWSGCSSPPPARRACSASGSGPSLPALARVGTLIEGAAFVPYLSGITNLRLWWQSAGASWADADVQGALDVAGLGAAIERKVKTYSHGMKQRLGIARALLAKPEVLVLDEPTTGPRPPGDPRGPASRVTALGRRHDDPPLEPPALRGRGHVHAPRRHGPRAPGLVRVGRRARGRERPVGVPRGRRRRRRAPGARRARRRARHPSRDHRAHGRAQRARPGRAGLGPRARRRRRPDGDGTAPARGRVPPDRRRGARRGDRAPAHRVGQDAAPPAHVHRARVRHVPAHRHRARAATQTHRSPAGTPRRSSRPPPRPVCSIRGRAEHHEPPAADRRDRALRGRRGRGRGQHREPALHAAATDRPRPAARREAR